jgi:hypothetical protein
MGVDLNVTACTITLVPIRWGQLKTDKMNRLRILLVILVATNTQGFGHAKTCETVYQTVDNNPTYDGGECTRGLFSKTLDTYYW